MKFGVPPLCCDLPASTVGRPAPPRPRSGVRTSRRLRWRATAGQPTSATAGKPTASAAFHPSHLQPIAAQPGTQYSRWQYIVFHLKKWASKGRGYLPDDDDDDAIFTTLTFCDHFDN